MAPVKQEASPVVMETLRRHVAHLNAELDEHRRYLGETQKRASRLEITIAELEADIAAHTRTIDALTTEGAT